MFVGFHVSRVDGTAVAVTIKFRYCHLKLIVFKMTQENKRSFDPMFPVSNRTKLIFKKLVQRNQEVNVLIPQINAGSDVESTSEDEDSFEPLKNID
ncbi:hypothetical protein JTB14_031010 [Gonioctena quinquepunctata]|nr:hypothetical protein JTB14_031010 [Gonioctena quinquepunctata]